MKVEIIMKDNFKIEQANNDELQLLESLLSQINISLFEQESENDHPPQV